MRPREPRNARIIRSAQNVLQECERIIAEASEANGPTDIECERVAAYYARKILEAAAAGEPVDRGWAREMFSAVDW